MESPSFLLRFRASKRPKTTFRSEEHTSELQSQSNLVCRLLLEKKNHTPHSCLPERNTCVRCPPPGRVVGSQEVAQLELQLARRRRVAVVSPSLAHVVAFDHVSS